MKRILCSLLVAALPYEQNAGDLNSGQISLSRLPLRPPELPEQVIAGGPKKPWRTEFNVGDRCEAAVADRDCGRRGWSGKQTGVCL